MDFSAAIDQFRNEIKDYEKKVSDAQLETLSLFIPKAKERTMFLFRETILEFYADYAPVSYKRRYSLFDIINIDTSVGSDQLFFNIEFDDANSPANNVFDPIDTVFEKGWHGGAPSGDGHPSPGTPYWRSPTPYYTKWYKPAAISASPYDEFVEKFKDFWEGGEAEAILDECWSACAQKYFN